MFPQTIEPPRPIHIVLIFILAVVWGSSFTMIKFSVAGLTPIGTAFMRLSIGFVALLPYAIYRGWHWPKGMWQWFAVLAVAFFGNALPFVLIAWAETKINAGLTALLLATVPFFALGFSHFLTIDDRINRFKVLGLCLSVSGVLITLWPDIKISNMTALLAIGAVLSAALCYAVSGITLRFVRDIPATRLSCLSLGLSSLMLLPSLALSWTAVTSNTTPSALLAVLYLGLIPTALATIIRYYLIPRVGMTWFSQSLSLIPIFGILFGALFLDETITYHLVISLVMVLAGLWVSKISPTASTQHR